MKIVQLESINYAHLLWTIAIDFKSLFVERKVGKEILGGVYGESSGVNAVNDQKFTKILVFHLYLLSFKSGEISSFIMFFAKIY